MNKKIVGLIAFFALCIGLICGSYIGKANVSASDTFWNGTAKGFIVEEDTIAQLPDEPFLVTPYSVGKECYASGTTFDLKDLQVGDVTYLTLYVRNNTKKITNVSTVITSTPNLEVNSPMKNSRIWPDGWTQFVFVIKAVDLGDCSINIGFMADD